MSELRAAVLASPLWMSVVASMVFGMGCTPPPEELGSGAEGQQEEVLGESEAEIVGGTLANGDPAVVAFTAEGTPFCSGTLVGPRTVVTAAHCVQAYGRGYNYYVFFGNKVDTTRPNQFVQVEAQYAHPNYRGNTGDPYDIAVLKLKYAVSGVTPIELNTEALADTDVGAPVRHVGFGMTSASSPDMGTKRQVRYHIREVGAAQFESAASGKQTCSGDSGGPAFMVTKGSSRERLAGVVSFGDAECRQFGVDTRVDVHSPWLKSVFEQWEQVAATP